MAISAKIKSGSGFNEGGGYTGSGRGTFSKGQLVSGGINQDTMALPGDGERHHSAANRIVEVLSYTFITDAATTVTWKSNTTAISGAMTVSANGGVAQSGTDDGSLLFTALGEDLKITNSAGNINGHFTYRII